MLYTKLPGIFCSNVEGFIPIPFDSFINGDCDKFRPLEPVFDSSQNVEK
jgi:hypothetical protein